MNGGVGSQIQIHQVFLALGSNMEPRSVFLRDALEKLTQKKVLIQNVSTFHETEPQGGTPGQGKYLNAAALAHTNLPPEQLLQTLLDIESSFGRDRSSGIQWAPRTLDLDILFYDDCIIQQPPRLIVPHPRLHQRMFVLAPLLEIAAEFRHPVFGLTIRELTERLIFAEKQRN